MNIKYFQETGTLYIEFRPGDIAESRDLDQNMVLDVDADANVCAITVEHASDRADRPHFSFEQAARLDRLAGMESAFHYVVSGPNSWPSSGLDCGVVSRPPKPGFQVTCRCYDTKLGLGVDPSCVLDLNLAVLKPEADAPLAIHPYAPLTGAVAAELLQPIPGRHPQLLNTINGIYHAQCKAAMQGPTPLVTEEDLAESPGATVRVLMIKLAKTRRL